MLSNISIKLSGLLKTVWMLDNNQKGRPKKIKGFSSSNSFVKVAGRTARNYILCEEDIGQENSKRIPITYIDQMIMNPLNSLVFENEIVDMGSNLNIQQYLLRNLSFNGRAVQLDQAGARVNIYNTLIGIVNTIECIILSLLSGYNTTSKKCKR